MAKQLTTGDAVHASGESGTEADEPIRVEMDKRVDLAVSLAMGALGIWIFYLASRFRLGAFPDPISTRGVAYFTGAYLFLAGSFLAARRVFTWSRIPGIYTVSEGRDDEPDYPSSARRAFSMMALALVWAILLEPVGFLIVTPIIIGIMLLLMNVRSPHRLAVFPLAFTLCSWAAFSQVLGMPLPYGPLTALARSWGLIY